jgi:tetratricopeptide (TPR) repeat protein
MQQEISGDRKQLVTSLSNNPFTSKRINRSKASDLAAGFSSDKKDIQSAYSAIVANRLAGKGPVESFDDARRILDHYIAKNPDADIPEFVQLELALAAIGTGRLALAEFYTDRLTKSKNSKIRAAAINALGVVAIRNERIPEAVAIFKEALAAEKSYEPALLNLGFLALEGGDVGTAKRALGGMQDDWFVESGLIGVERLEGDAEKAEQRCERVLAKQPKHKPTLINCGLNAYQGQKDFKKARSYLNRALAVIGGSSAWDEKTGKLLGVVDSEEAKAARAKANQEAEDAKAKADAEKAKAAPAPASPEKSSEGAGGATSPAPPAAR